MAKDTQRLEVLGDLDEATSAIGLARALAARAETKPLLAHLQRELFALMAEVAAPDAGTLSARMGAETVASLEADIDTLQPELTLPGGFILPGDSPGAGALDLARTIVRRTERHLVALSREDEALNPQLFRYLNRLSSLLFLLARLDDNAAGVEAPTMAIERED